MKTDRGNSCYSVSERPGEGLRRPMNRRLLMPVLLLLMAIPVVSTAGIIITLAPPVLPVYELPACPAPGYLWTPGYWSYGDAGYFWVPGVWIQPPTPGLLWTPGYWGFEGAAYVWHAGYWGPHIGFYGGVNYGFGFFGTGFVGGVWAGGVFRYNTAVLAVSGPAFHDVYVDKTVVVVGGPRFAFNGPGGVVRGPVAAERIAERDHHVEAVAAQREHEHTASLDRANRFSENHGRPAHAAMSRPGERAESRPGGARPGEGRPAAGHPAARPAGGAHPADHPAGAHPAEHPAEHPAGGAHPAAGAAHPAGGAHPAAPAHAPAGGSHPAAGGKSAPANHAPASHAPASHGSEKKPEK